MHTASNSPIIPRAERAKGSQLQGKLHAGPAGLRKQPEAPMGNDGFPTSNNAAKTMHAA